MKLNSISISGLIAARNVFVDCALPVQLIASDVNEAGKTSALEAVELVLGRMPRSLLKKDVAALVSSGHEKASIEVIGGKSGDIGKAAITATGKIKVQELGTWGQHPLTGYLLHPETIAPTGAKRPDELKAALFAALGLSADHAAVAQQLLNRKRLPGLVEKVRPMLRAGFDAAAKHAAATATQLKGEWRAATGEAWGSEKGLTWSAPLPTVPTAQQVDDMRAQLARIEKIKTEAQTQLTTLQERKRAQDGRIAQAQGYEATIATKERVARKLKVDRANLVQAQKLVQELEAKAGDAPREGLLHDLAAVFATLAKRAAGVDGVYELDEEAQKPEFFGFGDYFGNADDCYTRGREHGERVCADEVLFAHKAALDSYRAQYGEPGQRTAGDPEARAALLAARQSLELMQKAVANSERDMTAVANAEAALAALQAAGTDQPVLLTHIASAQAELELAQHSFEAARGELIRAGQQIDAAHSADANTKKALDIHMQIMGWLDISSDLEPSGIPGEMLAQAIGPVNQHMLRSCEFLGIDAIVLGADMSVTKGGHPYQMLSKGGQWIASAVLAVALSVVSEQHWVVLDGLDVLSGSARVDVLSWLDWLADEGELRTALVTATLKTRPNLGALKNLNVTWIYEGGTTTAPETEGATA